MLPNVMGAGFGGIGQVFGLQINPSIRGTNYNDSLSAGTMASTSAIEWTDATWNPVTGCTKISAGCDNCYAARFSERFRGVPGHPFETGFDLTLRPERLLQPFAWKRPRMIFVNSMSDLFHKEILRSHVAAVFDTQLGTNSVIRDQMFTDHGAAIRDGLNKIRAVDADVVLIDPQFAPKVIVKADAEHMVELIATTAKVENVDLFRRFDVMKHWRDADHMASVSLALRARFGGIDSFLLLLGVSRIFRNHFINPVSVAIFRVESRTQAQSNSRDNRDHKPPHRRKKRNYQGREYHTKDYPLSWRNIFCPFDPLLLFLAKIRGFTQKGFSTFQNDLATDLNFLFRREDRRGPQINKIAEHRSLS
jgi:hypothetical protein